MMEAGSTQTFPAVHIGVTIRRAPSDVYAFAGRPQNLPQWAAGLATGIRQDGDHWVADSPMGRVAVRFASDNAHGVLDHVVTLPSGETVHVPMRVMPNGDGSEAVLTLYRRPGMSDAALAEDAAAVRRDLDRLKALLEA